MPKNLSQIAKQKKIKYFLISFVDLFGVLRSKLVPAQAIAEMQKNGAGFAGFATWLDMTPADSDMFGVPDPDSLIQLPWNKEIGWLASDLLPSLRSCCSSRSQLLGLRLVRTRFQLLGVVGSRCLLSSGRLPRFSPRV